MKVGYVAADGPWRVSRAVSLRRAAALIGHAMSDEESLSCRPLYRSRSLPQLHTVGSYSEPLRRGAGGGTRLVAAEVRQLLTLKQHYYPEGGWGWVVVVVGMLVQLLSHGLHVASGVLVGEAVRRFGGGVVTPAGEYRMGAQSLWRTHVFLYPVYSLFCTVINAVSYSEGKCASHNRQLCEVYRRVRWAGLVDRVRREGMHA